MHYYFLKTKELNCIYRIYRVYRYKYCILLINCIYKIYRVYRCKYCILLINCIYKIYRVYRCKYCILLINCIYKIYRIYRCKYCILLIKYFVLKLVILGIITLYLVSWRFNSISNVRIKNWVELSWFNSKIIEIKLGFKSIPRVEIDESSRFQYLEPKPDPTINLFFTLF